MSKFQILTYSADHAKEWDTFVGTLQTSGSVLQSRRFLDYHGARFQEQSLVARDEKGALVAVFPAAAAGSTEEVVSHPGATYGGLLLKESLAIADVQEIQAQVAAHYAAAGVKKLLMRLPPSEVAGPKSAIHSYGWWQLGAKLIRKDLWNVVDLSGGMPRYSKGRKWGVKKAAKTGVTVRYQEQPDWDSTYKLLALCLAERHQQKPVHSHEELVDLAERLQSDMKLWVAYLPGEDTPAAMTLVFRCRANLWHTQYIASTYEAREECALDLLIDQVIQAAVADNVKTLTFGASTEQQGQVLNTGLYNFKNGFGGSAVYQDFVELDL